MIVQFLLNDWRCSTRQLNLSEDLASQDSDLWKRKGCMMYVNEKKANRKGFMLSAERIGIILV
jgi:hypothetical protein